MCATSWHWECRFGLLDLQPQPYGRDANWRDAQRVGLGRAAITAGYTVLFDSATTLIAQLVKAYAQGVLDEKLLHFSKPKLLIIDELCYLPIEPDAAHVLFQLVSRRYERGSILLTSNRAVSE